MSWNPPSIPNGEITEYHIYYESSSTSSTNEVINLSNPTTSFQLTNLKPYTLYNVSVAASTVAGRGPTNTPSVQFTTLESGELKVFVILVLF